MGHGHDHHAHGSGHGHDHGPESFGRAFAIGTALNFAFVLAEFGFGILANSVALVADAAHNLSDVVGLLLAWWAVWLGRRQPTARMTYGFRRASILAALANAALLFVTVGGIIGEALQRLIAPVPIAELAVLIVAMIGIAINGATALLFMRGRKGDINVRGAYLHMVGDAAVSLGVVVSALVIMATGWLWLDPLASLVIAGVILLGTWGLARDAMNLALDAVPSGIEPAAVSTYLRGLPGVTEIHDLHVWAMSTTETALTCHLVRPDHGLDDAFLARVARELETRFGIRHVTLQLESGDPGHPCRLAPADVV